MSPTGNRLTPASGRAPGTREDRSTAGRAAARSGVLSAVRWPRARSRPLPGTGGDDGRWGVARLVAQREAERRVATDPSDTDDLPAEAEAGEACEADVQPDDAVPAAEAPEVDASDDGAPASSEDDVPARAADDGVPGASGEKGAEPEDVPVAVVDTPEPATADDEPGRSPGPPAPRTPEPAVPPSPRTPLRTPLVPRPPLPSPRRPPVVRTGPVVPNAADARASRPRVEPDPSLFGFARHTRSRLGARVFTLFFVLVFALILVQTIASIV
ncbi:hypothetical protein [Pseudonocardia endophytica]|uniref:Uncharacterized protein n=1 Tax=Pseudonocardia endophytica TaxID=401976 RepID=A0A4R1I2K0_PSEEN|nr:hypothetical protein [Pseudonocardia endophytica]TCK27845.1 hypothetical protein EV378_3724 [Pseudonocardia endophytica]